MGYWRHKSISRFSLEVNEIMVPYARPMKHNTFKFRRLAATAFAPEPKATTSVIFGRNRLNSRSGHGESALEFQFLAFLEKQQGRRVTGVTRTTHPSLTIQAPDLRVPTGGSFLRDIYEVLRKKQAEQAQLGKQIEALQTAAEQLRSVAHLLNTEEEDERSSHQG